MIHLPIPQILGMCISNTHYLLWDKVCNCNLARINKVEVLEFNLSPTLPMAQIACPLPQCIWHFLYPHQKSGSQENTGQSMIRG